MTNEDYEAQLKAQGLESGNYGENGTTTSGSVSSSATPVTPAKDQMVQDTNIAVFIIPAVALILIVSVVAFKLGKRHR